MKALIQITRRLNFSRFFMVVVVFLAINTIKGQENDYSKLVNTVDEKVNSLPLSTLLMNFSFSDNDLNDDTESSDIIECWMMDTDYWLDISKTNEDEPEMEFEDWMFDTEFWTEFVEPAMEIESWMFDANYWNSKATMLSNQENELEIETWMSDLDYWNI